MGDPALNEVILLNEDVLGQWNEVLALITQSASTMISRLPRLIFP